jgi:hypothetical protein
LEKFHYINTTEWDADMRSNGPRFPAVVMGRGPETATWIEMHLQRRQKLLDDGVLSPSPFSYKDGKPFGILVHTSDEFMGESGGHNKLTEYYKYFTLVLRTYAFWRHPLPTNMMQLNLGFMVNMLSDDPKPNDVFDPSTNRTKIYNSTQFSIFSLSVTARMRNLKWTFVGGGHGRGKRDREEMISVFSSWGPNHVNHSMHPWELRKLYNESLFVVIGRGWVTLDCFRIYEAISQVPSQLL